MLDMFVDAMLFMIGLMILSTAVLYVTGTFCTWAQGILLRHTKWYPKFYIARNRKRAQKWLRSQEAARLKRIMKNSGSIY